MSNLTKDQLINDYDELLDSEGTVTVAGCEFYPSKILKELDPIAYRTGFSDYLDSLMQDGTYIEGVL